jgi:hypothetical protein
MKNKDDGEVSERDYVFALDEKRGEKVCDMYVGDWFFDKDGNPSMRYCLAGKTGGTIILIHYVLFVQHKRENVIAILSEGDCAVSEYEGKWDAFMEAFKENFKVDKYGFAKIELRSMDPERQQRMFESIIKAEV